MSEILATDMFVTPAGGVVDYVNRETGQLLMQSDIPAGLVRARSYLSVCPKGAVLRAGDGVVVVPRTRRAGSGTVTSGAGHYDSAANPNFKPGSADPLRRELEAMMIRMKASEKRIEARENALRKIERVPKAANSAAKPVEKPKEGETEVVE